MKKNNVNNNDKKIPNISGCNDLHNTVTSQLEALRLSQVICPLIFPFDKEICHSYFSKYIHVCTVTIYINLHTWRSASPGKILYVRNGK